MCNDPVVLAAPSRGGVGASTDAYSATLDAAGTARATLDIAGAGGAAVDIAGAADAALDAAGALLGSPFDRRDCDALTSEMVTVRRAVDMLELRFSHLAAALAETPEMNHEESEGPIFWMRHECRMTGYAAASALAVGEETTALPQSVAALEQGRIGFGHLALIARTSAAVRESVEAQGQELAASTPVLDERRLLNKATRHTVNRFRRDCAHVRHACDPDGALADHVTLVLERSLEIAARDDGCFNITGFLDPEGGAVLRTALLPLARRAGPDDKRTQDQRNADALVEFLHRGLADRLVSSSGGARPHLQVTASLETLTGAREAPAGELELGGTVPTATVQRLACDAAISRIVFGPESVITDVGRSLRVPAVATRRALRARDGGCVWPGCSRSASYTQAHHIVHWVNGGKTDLKNLVLLCHRHHWLVHEGGWTLARRTPPADSPCNDGGAGDRSSPDGEPDVGSAIVVVPPVHEHTPWRPVKPRPPAPPADP